MLSLLIEESALDLSALVINEFNVKNRTITSGVLIEPHLMLLGDSSLDLPIVKEGVKGLDGSVFNVIWSNKVMSSLFKSFKSSIW